MKFVMEINLGNDAMSSSADLSHALRRVADSIEDKEYVENDQQIVMRGIADVQGNHVGFWKLSNN